MIAPYPKTRNTRLLHALAGDYGWRPVAYHPKWIRYARLIDGRLLTIPAPRTMRSNAAFLDIYDLIVGRPVNKRFKRTGERRNPR